MRAVLLQLSLDSKSPAGNIQGLSAGISRAAGTTPAPDLLVLPGACDTGGVIPGRGLSDACLRSVREMIAWQAREWGVYIAAGLHDRRGNTLVPWAVLFDPDGDLVAWDPAPAADPDRPSPIEPWQTVVGTLGVVQPSVGYSLDDRLATVEQGAFIVMPLGRAPDSAQGCGGSTGVPPLGGELKVRAGFFWGVVAPAGYNTTSPHDRGLGTVVYDPKGRIIASARNDEETIVHAEVPLVAVMPKV